MKRDSYLPEQSEIGPFDGTRHKPVRSGLYKRITHKGNVVWSYFNLTIGKPRMTVDGYWGLFSSSKAKAVRKSHKRSKHQHLPWIGRSKT